MTGRNKFGIFDMLSNLIYSKFDWQGLWNFALKPPAQKWHNIVHAMNDEDLYRIILNINIDQIRSDASYEPATYPDRLLKAADAALKALLNSEVNYPSNDESQIEAYLYCLLEVYKRIRTVLPECESTIASVASALNNPLFTLAYKKMHKLDGCEKLQECIASGRWKQGRLEDDEVLKKHWGALNSHTLGLITALVSKEKEMRKVKHCKY